MKLRVHIECADCGEVREIHVLGGWDIKRVKHQCHGELGRQCHEGRELLDGEFAVEFEPRRAFV